MGYFVRLCCLLLLVWNKSAISLVISDIKRTDLVVINPKPTTSSFLTDIGTRLSTIEERFKKLSHISRERDFELQMLIDRQNRPVGQQQMIDRRLSGGEDEKKNQTDIVYLIKSNEFQKAEKELIAVGAEANISAIVREAYAALETELEPIIIFAVGLSNITNSFHIFKALAHEMQANGDQDPYKLIRFGEGLRLKVAVHHLDPNAIKADAVEILNGLDRNITTIARKYLVDAMTREDYQKSSAVHLLADAIDDYRTEVSDNMMRSLVEASYERIEPSKILTNVLSHSRLNQAITGIIVLFGKLKNSGQLNNDRVLDIAFHLSKLRNRYDYVKLSPKKIHAVDKVVEDIPTCARSLFFEQSVCLWNKEQEGYLYAGDSSTNYDGERRRIFVSSAMDNVPPAASWFVDKVGDNILFKSVKYVNEYLYAVLMDDIPGVHYVFNWIPGKNTDAQSEWKIELNGNYCYIRSKYFDEPLYTSRASFMNLLHAFTSKSDVVAKDSNILWQIRGC